MGWHVNGIGNTVSGGVIHSLCKWQHDRQAYRDYSLKCNGPWPEYVPSNEFKPHTTDAPLTCLWCISGRWK